MDDGSSAFGRTGATRRTFLSASAATAGAAALLSTAVTVGSASAATLPKSETDADLRRLISEISPARIEATITRLVQFGTRHTASSQTDPERGIGAATTWVFNQMQAIAAASSGRMTVERQSFMQQAVPPNLPEATTITNVIATLKGTASPERFYVITGHLDSRVTDVTDFTSDAPGADDDASGVAVVLELARLFATRQFPGTLVFAAVDGEEQGLFGSAFMAAQMKKAGADVQGMFSNDIVGASQAFDGTKPDPFSVRLFVEGVPAADSAAQISLIEAVGGENDGGTHQLARFVTSAAPASLTGMNIRVIWRRDRYLRGSDHASFQAQGYPAARITEPRENFNHEHRDVEVINGVEFGDRLEFVDFGYTARVAKVNAAALWALATNPATPKNVKIHVTPPVGFAGINDTVLTWDANAETDLSGYEVVTRETSAPDWTQAIPVGNVTSVTLDIAKDNLQFGVRAVDKAGHRSPVGFPTTVTT